MVDYTALNAAVADDTTQVAATETTEAAATVLINGFSASLTKAVTDALTADDAANQGTIDAVTAAIKAVTARYTASAAPLGAAVVAGTPVAPTQTPAA